MKNRMHNPVLRAAAKRGIVITTFLLMTSPIYACPMCKDSTPIDPAAKTTTADNVSLNFNKSIYVMLGGFVSVIGFTGRVMYKAAKKSV